MFNSAGEWVDVPIIEGTFVINIGDLMARWTNDAWVSTLHRVANPPGRGLGGKPAAIGGILSQPQLRRRRILHPHLPRAWCRAKIRADDVGRASAAIVHPNAERHAGRGGVNEAAAGEKDQISQPRPASSAALLARTTASLVMSNFA